MKITPYNQLEALDYIRALSLQLLMSKEIQSLDGYFANRLFDAVGDMTEEEAANAIRQFEATQ